MACLSWSIQRIIFAEALTKPKLEGYVSTKYIFDLIAGSKTMQLILNKNPVGVDGWTVSHDEDDCLLASGGVVDSHVESRLICHTGPSTNLPVVILLEASWDSDLHATGDARCEVLESKCPAQWEWRLTSKS